MLEAEEKIEEAIRVRKAVDRDQRQRRTWILASTASYGVDVLFLVLFSNVGTISAQVPLTYGLIAAAITGGAYLATARGWNLKMPDPNLTEPLSQIALLMQLAVVAVAPQIGFLYLANLFTVFGFAMLWLTLQESVLIWSFGVVGVGTLFVIVGDRIGVPMASPAERWLVWGYFSLILGRCLLISVVSGDMRARLGESRRRLADSLNQVQQLASHDELTRVLNRRALVSSLERERERAERSGTVFSIGMMDLDHFKSVNDTYGHGVGDAVLREFAAAVSAAMRVTDVFGRYGGEEFLIILVGSEPAAALDAMERIRTAVAARDWNAIAPGLTQTLSAGVASFRKGGTIEQMLHGADQAMYEAKRAGRNRIEVSTL